MENSSTKEVTNYEPFMRPLNPLKLAQLKRVLIVEDDLSLTHILRAVLNEISPNADIQWATSGEEAKHYLARESYYFKDNPFELVVADIFLEGEITGLDICKYCKEQYPQVNLLIMSSLPEEKFISHLETEGTRPYPYLQKPFSLKECKKTLRQFL